MGNVAFQSYVHTIEFAVAVDIYEAADQWKDFEITDVAPVQVIAYEDPDNKGTFYSSTEAYKVPQTATAFAVVNKATGKMELICRKTPCLLDCGKISCLLVRY